MSTDSTSSNEPKKHSPFRIPKFNLTQVGLAIMVVNICVGGMLLWKLQTIENIASKTAALEKRIDKLPTTLADAVVDAEYRKQLASQGNSDPIPLKSSKDVEIRFAELGESPDIEKLSLALTEVEDWPISETDLVAVEDIRQKQLQKLRDLVAATVTSLQQQALGQPAARDGYVFHAKAQAILAYFPADTNNNVTEQLRTLLEKQSTVATKLDAIQRMRYNNWASSEISKALIAHDKNKSLRPWAKNEHLIGIVSAYLEPIDPTLLEPATRQANMLVVQTTQESLGRDFKTRLPQRLTRAGIQRINLNQF